MPEVVKTVKVVPVFLRLCQLGKLYVEVNQLVNGNIQLFAGAI
jgi:hypothetical protein